MMDDIHKRISTIFGEVFEKEKQKEADKEKGASSIESSPVEEKIKGLENKRKELGAQLHEDISPEEFDRILNERYDLVREIRELAWKAREEKTAAEQISGKIKSTAKPKQAAETPATQPANNEKQPMAPAPETDMPPTPAKGSAEKIEAPAPAKGSAEKIEAPAPAKGSAEKAEAGPAPVVPAPEMLRSPIPEERKMKGKPRRFETGQKKTLEEEKAMTDPGALADKFIEEYSLAGSLPESFVKLKDAEKFFVVQNLKKKILDIVKENAETQYSEYVKKNVFQKAEGGRKLTRLFKNLGINAANATIDTLWKKGLNKEFAMRRIEGETWKAIQATPEGAKLIAENMDVLSRSAAERKIGFNEKTRNSHIIYASSNEIPNCNAEEEKTIFDFNEAANQFRSVPYEWSQEKKSSFKHTIFEQRKAAYEKLRGAMYAVKMKGGRAVPIDAMLDMKQVDALIQEDQIRNTHPEFEQKLVDLENKAAGYGVGKAFWKTALNIGHQFTGGKGKYNNASNKLLFAGGWFARTGEKVLSVTPLGFVAAPAVGYAAGSIRGKLKAKEMLKKNKEDARYGKKDQSKARAKTADISRLSSRLDRLAEEMENVFSDNSVDFMEEGEEKKKFIEQREKRLALLSTSIAHASGKMERGEVNFGNAKSRDANLFNFTNSLNRALVVQAALSGETNLEMNNRVNRLVGLQAKRIESETKIAQKEFIKKQMKQAAIIGAGAATFGYVVHWAADHWPHHIAHSLPKIAPQPHEDLPRIIPTQTIPNAPIEPPPYDTSYHGIDTSNIGTTDTTRHVVDTAKAATRQVRADTIQPDTNANPALYHKYLYPKTNDTAPAQYQKFEYPKMKDGSGTFANPNENSLQGGKADGITEIDHGKYEGLKLRENPLEQKTGNIPETKAPEVGKIPEPEKPGEYRVYKYGESGSGSKK